MHDLVLLHVVQSSDECLEQSHKVFLKHLALLGLDVVQVHSQRSRICLKHYNELVVFVQFAID
jgi:hypothetical protein